MGTIIEGKGLSKSFGGLAAVKKIDFYLGESEIVGLIGPNGAGKTTLFNLISGIFHPDEGTLRLDGKDITRLRPFEICRLGIGRTYQIVRPFLKMKCLENVMVGIIGRNDRNREKIEIRQRNFSNLSALKDMRKRSQTTSP